MNASPKPKKSRAKAKTVEAEVTVASVAVATVAPTQQVVVVKQPKAPPPTLGKLEKVLIEGDLAVLTEEERLTYYKHICDLMGLEPSTKPFAYIVLNSKLVLYATKNCTDQISQLRKLSTEMTEPRFEHDLVIVRCRVVDQSGRSSQSIGAVSTSGQTGEKLANALMKAETKAKRRAILSLVGLSVLDETEVESIRATSIGADAITALENKHVQKIAAPKEKEAHVEHVEHVEPTDVVETDVVDVVETKEAVEKETTPPPVVEKSKAKNSSGVLYPAVPPEVIKMLKQGRYMNWLNWIETEGFWDDFKIGGGEAFQKDFEVPIRMAKNYGGYHWRRVKEAFAKASIILQD